MGETSIWLRTTLPLLFAAIVAVAPGRGRAQEVDAGADAAAPDAAAADTGAAADPAAEAAVVSVATVVQEANEAEARLEADARLAERSPQVGSVRAHLASSDTDFLAVEPRVTPEALTRIGRSDLSELLRLVGGMDRDRASDQEVLDARVAELSELTTRLEEAQIRWSEAERELRATPGAPPLVVQRSGALVHRIETLRGRVVGRTSAVVQLQNALSEHRDGIGQVLERLNEAQTEQRARLFSRTSPPIWAALAETDGGPTLQVSLEGSWTTFYAAYGRQLPLHIGLFVLLLLAVIALSRWTARGGSATDDDSVAILSRPVAAALMVGLVAIRFIYPRAPAAVFHAAAAIALLPLVRLLPTLIRRRVLHKPIWALLGLFAAQELTIFLPLAAPLPRVLSLAITIVFLIGVVVVLRRGDARPESDDAPRLLRVVPRALSTGAFVLGISALAEVFGFSNLSALLTPGLLNLAYVLFLLLAAVRVLDAVVSATLHSSFMQLSRTVRIHRELLDEKIRGVLHFLTAVAWLYGALKVFDLEERAREMVIGIFGWQVAVGSWSLSLGDFVGFGFVLWLTLYVSRILGFLLEEDVLPRLDLPRGAPATVSRLVRYGIWLLGFIAAIGAAGVDMSSVALLVSALGVGIGFGLQNIVNNFVSGLVLIFERPIRVGDVVEVGGMVSRVKDIGLRASVVRTLRGAEVIVPNADLVSAQVINWTLSDQRRRIDVPVGVAYGTDPQKVIDILVAAASEIEEILDEPKSVALFLGFGASSLDFELRFWIDLKHDWPIVASASLVQINAALREANIEIPFPQRDLHVRSVAPEAAAIFEKQSS